MRISFAAFQKWDVVVPVTRPDVSPLSVQGQGPEEFCRVDQLGNE